MSSRVGDGLFPARQANDARSLTVRSMSRICMRGQVEFERNSNRGGRAPILFRVDPGYAWRRLFPSLYILPPNVSSQIHRRLLHLSSNRAIMAVCARSPAVLDACNATARGSASFSIQVSRTEAYVETGILGGGSFGVVLQARHRVTGNTVAIKFLRSTVHRPADPSRLLEEARFLGACDGNPYVVAYYGLVHDPATADLGLAMEYVGPSLHTFLSERPPLLEGIVCCYMWQLLTGAKMMHQRGIVHRDIKPANILVEGGGKMLKFCDLGLAMSLATKETPYGDVGTMPYKPPEMILGKPNYDGRVDTWSLGCVMAEMLTGQRMFPGLGDDDEVKQLWVIFRRVGFPDETTWPELASLPLARMVPRWTQARQQQSTLREMFHEEMLSNEGFQVLKGLLECNPDKRLTAAAALQLPWFQH
uniref:Uncharacterized protein n=1 Tax=Avena sativa TaxID=4498 RepID=A0ACD5XMC0_AVESA